MSGKELEHTVLYSDQLNRQAARKEHAGFAFGGTGSRYALFEAAAVEKFCFAKLLQEQLSLAPSCA